MFGRAVEHCRVSFRCEAIFVSVAANASDPLENEIKQRAFETRLLQKRDHEGSKTAINVKPDFPTDCELRKGLDVVDDAVGEIRRRSNKNDGIGVDQPGNGSDVHLEIWWGTCYQVKLDLEVFGCLVERSVCRLGNDPGFVSMASYLLSRVDGCLHLRLRYSPLGVSLLSCREASHQNALSPSTC